MWLEKKTLTFFTFFHVMHGAQWGQLFYIFNIYRMIRFLVIFFWTSKKDLYLTFLSEHPIYEFWIYFSKKYFGGGKNQIEWREVGQKLQKNM